MLICQYEFFGGLTWLSGISGETEEEEEEEESKDVLNASDDSGGDAIVGNWWAAD